MQARNRWKDLTARGARPAEVKERPRQGLLGIIDKYLRPLSRNFWSVGIVEREYGITLKDEVLS